MENYDDQIALLTKRVYHLEQEIIRLGGQPYKANKPAETKAQAAIPAASVEKTVKTETIASTASTEQVKAEATPKKAVKTAPVKQKKDMENKIGKNVMAMLASVLIFLSLVLFAGIAFRYLSDTMKAVIMFIISAAIAIVGIVKMPKKGAPSDVKFGVFYTALAACGVGAIYITDLVAYFGFNCIPLVPFIISLAVWIVATMFLAYNRSKIFIYICNVGLIIAAVLTTLQFESSILGFVIYTVCLIALYLINRHDDFNVDCFYFIQYPIMFIVLSSVVETNIYTYLIFAVMMALVFAYANFMYKITMRQFPTNLVTALLNIAAIIRIAAAGSEDYIAYVVITLLLLTMAMYYFKHLNSIPALFYIIFTVTYFVAIGVFFTTTMYIIVAVLPYIAFLILGFYKKDLYIRLGGYLAIVISFAIHVEHFSFWPVFILYFVIVALAVAYTFLKDYSYVDKYIQTFLALMLVSDILIKDTADSCIVFILLTSITFILNSKLYILDKNTKEPEFASQIIAYIACGYMIAFGLFAIYTSSFAVEPYQLIVYSLMTLAVCTINTKKLFEIKIPEILPGIYVCLKFSALIYVILHRLNAVSYIVSVAGILVAIVCIIVGFSIKHKSFRLYGLVLSLICVIKLILFDIKYDSVILRPIGFFVAGVLCFAISFIYSKLEKGVKQ